MLKVDNIISFATKTSYKIWDRFEHKYVTENMAELVQLQATKKDASSRK